MQNNTTTITTESEKLLKMHKIAETNNNVLNQVIDTLNLVGHSISRSYLNGKENNCDQHAIAISIDLLGSTHRVLEDIYLKSMSMQSELADLVEPYWE